MKKHPKNNARDVEIERLYSDEKLSLRMISRLFDITLQRVHQILVKRNVKMRPKHITRYAANYLGVSKDTSCGGI